MNFVGGIILRDVGKPRAICACASSRGIRLFRRDPSQSMSKPMSFVHTRMESKTLI